MHLKQYCYVQACADFAYFVPENFVMTLRNCLSLIRPARPMHEPFNRASPGADTSKKLQEFYWPCYSIGEDLQTPSMMIWMGLAQHGAAAHRNSSNWLSHSTAVMRPCQTCVCVCVCICGWCTGILVPVCISKHLIQWGQRCHVPFVFVQTFRTLWTLWIWTA